MPNVSRYHPLLVTLHWLMAGLIVGLLLVGFFGLAMTPNTDPKKLDILQWHMAGGMLALFLVVVRLIVRWQTAKPPTATVGNPALDRLAPATHYGFYVLVILMAGTGYATGLLAGLPDSVFGRTGAPLPESFTIFPTRIAHGYLAAILTGLLVLHVLAALYHQFVRQDRLFRRMWYGRRVREPNAPID